MSTCKRLVFLEIKYHIFCLKFQVLCVLEDLMASKVIWDWSLIFSFYYSLKFELRIIKSIIKHFQFILLCYVIVSWDFSAHTRVIFLSFCSDQIKTLWQKVVWFFYRHVLRLNFLRFHFWIFTFRIHFWQSFLWCPFTVTTLGHLVSNI